VLSLEALYCISLQPCIIYRRQKSLQLAIPDVSKGPIMRYVDVPRGWPSPHNLVVCKRMLGLLTKRGMILCWSKQEMPTGRIYGLEKLWAYHMYRNPNEVEGPPEVHPKVSRLTIFSILWTTVGTVGMCILFLGVGTNDV
jgi:hypothetical protein